MILDVLKTHSLLKHAHLLVTNIVKKDKRVGFLYSRFEIIHLVFLCCILLVVVVCLVFLFGNGIEKSQNISQESGSTWEISLLYNTQTKKITFSKLTLLKEKIEIDERSIESDYSIVLKKNNESLYSSSIFISTGLVFTIMAGDRTNTEFQSSAVFSDSLPLPEPQEIESIVYAPAITGATEIIIKHEDEIELIIPLPNIQGEASLSQIAQSACGALQAVFISDGYTDFSKFRQDVERLKQVFVSTEPYSSKQSMFDFKILENSTALGCKQSIGCVSNNVIQQIGRQAYPQASKFIVIADTSYVNPPPGTGLGVINGIGGNVMVFPRSATLQGREMVDQIAVHEFLGHGVGFLYDRYVLSGSASVKRNCSNSSSGESFWQAAGVTQTYQGCYAESAYAPAPNDCSPGSNSSLVSGGSRGSVMSAGGCGASVFDQTETYYIKNYILPKYNSCTNTTNTPIVTSTPTAASTFTPTVSPTFVCDPDTIGTSKGIVDFADRLVARREASGILNTNKASCMTLENTQTTIADIRKIHRIMVGLEAN